MNPSHLDSNPGIIINTDRPYAWTIYHRLQQLAIPCRCQCNEPLQVDVETPATVIQLWSVIRQVTASRTVCVSWLERCLSLRCQEPFQNS